MINYDLLEIENTATRLRTLFIGAKTKQLGRNYRPSAKIDTKENWNKAAIKCEGLDVSPEDFINAVFSKGIGKKHGGPYVNHLFGDMCEKAVQEYSEAGGGSQHEGQLRSEITSASNQCFSALNYNKMSAEDYLLKDTVPVRAWVWLYLCQNSKRIWRKYCDTAKIEMSNDNNIAKLLKQFNFKTETIYEFDKYS